MKFSLALLLAIGSAVHAAEGYTIKQLLLNRNRVVVEGAGMQVGQELIATFRNGSQCALKVTAVQGRIANADTSECSGAQYLTAGQSVERNLSIDEQPRKARANVKDATSSRNDSAESISAESFSAESVDSSSALPGIRERMPAAAALPAVSFANRLRARKRRPSGTTGRDVPNEIRV